MLLLKTRILRFRWTSKMVCLSLRLSLSIVTSVVCVSVHVSIPHAPGGREAWRSLGNMSESEAMKQYVAAVTSIAPSWETLQLDPTAQVCTMS